MSPGEDFVSKGLSECVGVGGVQEFSYFIHTTRKENHLPTPYLLRTVSADEVRVRMPSINRAGRYVDSTDIETKFRLKMENSVWLRRWLSGFSF